MDDAFQPALLDVPRKRRAPNLLFNPKEFKLVALRECPTPAEMQLCDTPDKAAAYWRQHVPAHPYFNRDVERFVVLLVNTRRKILGHSLISTGTLDTVLVHPREVFRPAMVGAAAAIVLMHNHPSGDPTPSEADIKVTRDLIRGGQPHGGLQACVGVEGILAAAAELCGRSTTRSTTRLRGPLRKS